MNAFRSLLPFASLCVAFADKIASSKLKSRFFGALSPSFVSASQELDPGFVESPLNDSIASSSAGKQTSERKAGQFSYSNARFFRPTNKSQQTAQNKTFALGESCNFPVALCAKSASSKQTIKRLKQNCPVFAAIAALCKSNSRRSFLSCFVCNLACSFRELEEN